MVMCKAPDLGQRLAGAVSGITQSATWAEKGAKYGFIGLWRFKKERGNGLSAVAIAMSAT
jgi:hypothetical protein